MIKVDPAFRNLTWEEWVERYTAARAEQGFTRSVSLPDPTPMAPPLGYRPQPSLRDQIREMILSERLRVEAEAAGAETFEEADDFEVEDFDPHSPYEVNFDPVEELRSRRRWEAEVRAEADRRDLVDNPPAAPPPPPAAPPAPPEPPSDQ